MVFFVHIEYIIATMDNLYTCHVFYYCNVIIICVFGLSMIIICVFGLSILPLFMCLCGVFFIGERTVLTVWYFFFIRNTIKPVYKGHSRGPEDVAFMISCPLYTGSNYMHYSLMGKMRLTFTNRDLLYLEVPMIILVLKLHFNYLEGTINFTILRKQNQIELFNGTNINRQSI